MGDLATAEGRLTRLATPSGRLALSAVENAPGAPVAGPRAPPAAGGVAGGGDPDAAPEQEPPGPAIRKLLAQALVANGQTSEAVQELEEAYAGAPDDDELAFTLALGYLRLKKVDAGRAPLREDR